MSNAPERRPLLIYISNIILLTRYDINLFDHAQIQGYEK